MTSITKNNLDTIKACRYCPMCRQSCPSEFINYKESDTPRGRGILLHNVYKADKEYDESIINSIYNCFVCGSCTSWCEGHDIGGYDIPELIKFARRDIIRRGMAPVVVEEIKASLQKNDNPYQLEKKLSFTEMIKEKYADVIYYLGPEVNFKNHEIAKAVIVILEKAGISYTLLNKEPSSGKILDLLGYRKDAQEKAKVLIERVKASGCKTLVVSDPLAYDAFISDYPEWNMDFQKGLKIVHVSEYLSELIKSGEIKIKKTKIKTTLADSEFLGRFNEVFEAPREVIKASVQENYSEMMWHHKYLQSTGEAAFTFNDEPFKRGKELGRKISLKAEAINSEMIITLSATAKNNIAASTDLKVMDIAEFVAELI